MKAILSVLIAFGISTASIAQTPILSSYPSATATIYLDFDGYYVTGTAWNWFGPIDAQPAGLDSATITQIFNRVSEDYRIFNLNITTDSTVYNAAPANQRIRIIITPTYEWYGMAGGISFVGSFTWGDGTPSWVFSSLLANNPKYVAEAISHEAGHTLGLQHQSTYDASCSKTAEYAPGQGSGQIGWAPIMGVGYYKNLTTWHTGTNSVNCATIQNDVDTIAGTKNNFGLRTDDYGNTPATADPLSFSGGYDFTATGIINSYSDNDVFKFDVSSNSNFLLTAIPQNVGTNNDGANVDIKVSLLDSKYDTVGQYNPSDLLNAGLDTNLTAGRYYLVVDGVSNANLTDYGSVGLYSLAGSIGSVLPIKRLTLNGQVNGDSHLLNWVYQADATVKKIELQTSRDGIHFYTLASLSPDSRSYNTQPYDKGLEYYRVRVVVASDESAYYSNIVSLRDESHSGSGIDLYSNIVSGDIRLQAYDNYTFQVFDESGRLLKQGQLLRGYNRVALPAGRKGLLLFRVQNGPETFTKKLIQQ